MNQAVLTPVTKENIQWQQPKEVIKAILETDSTDVIFKSLSNKMMHHKWEISYHWKCQPKEVIKAILETDSTDVFKSLSNKMMHNKREITPIIEDAFVFFLFFFFFFNVNISAFRLITF